MDSSHHNRCRFRNVAVLCLALSAVRAEAWGPVGHRAIAVIAGENLTPAAKVFVENRLAGKSMADVASWADSVTKDPRYPGSIWYHFEKMPDGASYLDNLRALPEWQRKKGGAVAAILAANDILRDPQATLRAQTLALKFLIHLAGDIHQPLHTGRPEDKGGVSLKIKWFGTSMSLHRVWDSGLILTGHPDLLPPGLSPRAAGTAYARYLAGHFTGQPVATEMDAEGWLNESLALRPSAYEPEYLTDQEQYQARHLEEIDRQVYAAGLRLARMLNDIAAQEPIPVRETELKNQIEIVTGDLQRYIRLRPRYGR